MFKIEIKIDGAAFGCEYDEPEIQKYDKRNEVCKILKCVEEKIKCGYTSGVCIDTNGNKVGKWELD